MGKGQHAVLFTKRALPLSKSEEVAIELEDAILSPDDAAITQALSIIPNVEPIPVQDRLKLHLQALAKSGSDLSSRMPS